MSPEILALLAQALVKPGIARTISKFGPAVAMGLQDQLPARLEGIGAKTYDPNGLWNKHEYAYGDYTGDAFNQYGGWNRDSRNMKSFAGGADYALRHPGKEDEAKILAGLYQGKEALGAALSPDTTMLDEFQDYRANAAGIDMAKLAKGLQPDSPATKALLSQQANAYADAIRARKQNGR